VTVEEEDRNAKKKTEKIKIYFIMTRHLSPVTRNLSSVTRHPSLVTIFFVLVLASCKPDPPVMQVPIGVAVSLTGGFSPYGIIQKNGINMAIDEINLESAIAGFKFIPFILDDQSSPATCHRIYSELITVNKVIAIIGPTSSNSAFPADSLAQKSKVVVVGISNTVPGITEIGDYIFRNSLPESAVIPNTVEVTHSKLGYSKVAIIYGNDDPYTIGAYNAFKKALENTSGISIVATETIHKGDTDFGSQMSRILVSSPDVIVIPALVNEASAIMIKARQMGIPARVKFIGGNSFNTSKLWLQAGEAAQGAICGSAWIYTEDTPDNADFVSKYTAIYGSKPDQFAAQAYASVYIIADAIKRSGTPTSETLRNNLANTSNLPTVLGTFSFDLNRDPVHLPVVQELVNGEFILYH
jgi:branched-chain amino acid transport system substrate-binding protein